MLPESSWLTLEAQTPHIGIGCQIAEHAVIGRVPPRGYTSRDPVVAGPTIIGAHCLIGVGAVVYAGATLGAHCLIGDGAMVREGCVLGDRVALHWHVTCNYDVTIGDDTVIGTGSHLTGGMQIGALCFFGAGVMTANDPEPRRPYAPDHLLPITIGDGVLIGVGAILLPGITIGDGATIGAGALVDQDVPAGGRVAGVRGRRV